MQEPTRRRSFWSLDRAAEKAQAGQRGFGPNQRAARRLTLQMIRSFIAISLPEPVRDEIDLVQDDLRGAMWTPEENLHLTLVFLGEQTRRTLEDLDALLLKVTGSAFALELAGVGHFGGRDPRLAWVGVRESVELRRLQAKLETAARGAGVAVADRRYTPHVTVARWGRREVAEERLREWVARNSLFSCAPFEVTGFELVQSELSRHGAVYTPLARYELTPPTAL